MEVDIFALLSANMLLLLFMVIGIGYLVGKIRVLGIPVDPTIGVLLAGLVFGHFGLEINSAVGTFGFALFIFSIGIEAGPSFFSAFKEDGPKYIALAAVVAMTAFGIVIGLAKVIGYANGFDAGLLAGSLTSTPTLAGAQDAIRGGLAVVPENMDADMLLENVGVGYAISYLFGTVCIIMLVRYAPKLLNLNLEAMAITYAKEKGLIRDKRVGPTADTMPIIRAYRVGADVKGKTLGQRRAEINMPGASLSVKRGKEILSADEDLELQEGDILSVIASLAVHQWVQETFGSEILDVDLLDYRIDSRELVVMSNLAVGRTLRDLNLPRTHACWPTGVIRAGIELPVSDELVILKGDRLNIVGEDARLEELSREFGYLEEDIDKTDLLTFSFGIVAGVLLGLVVVKAGGISIGLGMAGGLLIMGIIIGYVSSIAPNFGRVPAGARFMLKELGLMLLMASIGLNAGGGIVAGLTSVGPAIVFSALLVAIIPAAVGYIFGRKVLKMNPALLLGSITGAMTSTPALAVVTTAAKSAVPAIGYAGTYTFANIFLTFAGAFIMTI
ncbi:MAG: aspartate:alanine exchanger family transporter [Gammaproteobacteria bacterium]